MRLRRFYLVILNTSRCQQDRLRTTTRHISEDIINGIVWPWLLPSLRRLISAPWECSSSVRESRRSMRTTLISADEIHFRPPIPPVKDVTGGAGTFSALGARLVSPPPRSQSVGWIVDCGSDFPKSMYDSIGEWDTTCVFRETPERLTTRGWNGYGENEHRGRLHRFPLVHSNP
jgi:hypothetical protein